MAQAQPHVVAVPLPAQGHLNPLMRFCTLLASRHGFLVTFVNVDPLHHRMQDLLHAQAAEEHAHHNPADCPASPDASDEAPSPNIRRAHIPIHGLDLASDFRFSLQPFFEAQNTIAPHLELLIRKLNRCGPPVTCIVSDVGMTVPTQNVADNLNIPRIAFQPSSASLLLLYHHIIQGENISTTEVLEALTRRSERREEIVGEGLAGLPTIYSNEVPWFKHVVDDNAYLWEFSTKVCEESFRHARAIVINSFDDLEAPALMALSKHVSVPVYAVGPLVEPLHKENSTSLWKEDEACILWLDQQPPLSVLYISFGSISLLPQAQIEEIVAGLISSSQHFLWVFRPDLAENVADSSAFISDVLSRSDGKGYVVNWAPQLSVLSHPSVGGFLTHCGWNSTMEAIMHGVPMLCWPYFADQFLDAKYIVEEWKVGLQFEASSKEGVDCLVVEREEVERVIKAVMHGEEGRALRKNAMRLKEAGSQSLLPGGTSHNNMQALLRSFM